MTVVEFVAQMFVPEHVAAKGLSGRIHYHAILKHVCTPEDVDRWFQIDEERSKTKLKALRDWPYLGQARLCDVRCEDVQRLIDAAMAVGYSSQTVKHIRNVVSAIFAHATKKRCFVGDNPAARVLLPAMARKEAHVLTLDQAKEVLAVMRYPEKEMTLITILTSMNVAEICGMQWKHINLTGDWCLVDGEPLAPRSIAVRQHWYRHQLAGIPQKSRKRNLPIPDPLFPVLLGLSRRPSFTGPEDFVIVSRAGKPINGRNIATARLTPIGRNLQMPWLNWQVFRRTHATLGYEVGMQFLGERMARAGASCP